MGLLTITGAVLHTAQFWPVGSSDADTVVLDVSNATFSFKPNDQAASVPTKVFEGAKVKGNPCIHKPANNHVDSITVRLQGVDAPELHYRPQLPSEWQDPTITEEQRDEFREYNNEFRQALAEEAVVALAAHLKAVAQDVPVRVESRVDLPGDVFDAYGRFIGDVIVPGAVEEENISRWLLMKGWAFPSYYDSLSPQEIAALNAAWAKGRPVPGGVWAHFRAAIPDFDENMLYRKAPGAAAQNLVLTNPKLFRRQTVWWAGRRAHIWKESFHDYLARAGEQVMRTSDFLFHGRAAPKYALTDFITRHGTVGEDPEGLILLEAEARLVDAGGKEVISWIKEEKEPEWADPISINAVAVPAVASSEIGKKSPNAWVNTVAASNDGSRLLGGTFIHDYRKKSKKKGRFGIFCYDKNGARLWAKNSEGGGNYKEAQDPDSHKGWDGVFAVAISGDGSVAAAAGWHDRTTGLLRAYDAAGGKLLDCATIPKRINSVSLSSDGKILAAAADRVHVFQRNGGQFTEMNAHPDLTMNGSVTAVAVHPDGSWLVACTMSGQILMATLAGGQVANTYKCPKPRMQPLDRVNPNSGLAPAPLLCVAIAGATQTGRFVVGGGDFVYVCTKNGMIQQQDPVEIDTWDSDAPIGKASGGVAENVRWLALSPNGQLLAVAANREIAGQGRGVLLACQGPALAPSWRLRLPHYPNCVSVDAAGQYIAIAFGYPENSPGGFSLVDANGKEVWHCGTDNMNWPIAAVADGTAFVAGGNDGKLYYFTP